MNQVSTITLADITQFFGLATIGELYNELFRHNNKVDHNSGLVTHLKLVFDKTETSLAAV
jgi:hypothetical protein